MGRVDPERGTNRTIHNQGNRRPAGAGCRIVIMKLGSAQPSHRGQHHGEILGQTAGHHCIDGHLLSRDGHVAFCNSPQTLLRLDLSGLQHRPNRLFGWRDERQPVTPALLVIELNPGRSFSRVGWGYVFVHRPSDASWSHSISIARESGASTMTTRDGVPRNMFLGDRHE